MNDIALNPSTVISSAVLQKSLLRLSEFSQLPSNWNGNGSLAPSSQSVETCERFLTIWAEVYGFMPFVYPLLTGGIQLEWENEQWGVEIQIANDSAWLNIEVCNKSADDYYSEQWSADTEFLTQRLSACSKSGQFKWVSESALLQKKIKQCWLNHIHANPKEVTAAQHAVYALLRAKSLDKTFPPKKEGREEIRFEVKNQSVKAALNLNCRAWKPWENLLKEQGAVLDAKDGILRWHSNYAKTPSTALFDRAFAAK